MSTPFRYPLKVPPWIVELLEQWAVLDLAPRHVSDEMLALVNELFILEQTNSAQFMAIQRHFKPWISKGQEVYASHLVEALCALAARLDAELGP